MVSVGLQRAQAPHRSPPRTLPASTPPRSARVRSKDTEHLGRWASPPPAASGWPHWQRLSGRLAGEGAEALTHGSRLVLAAAVDREHTEPVLGELAWGTPAAGLAASWAWLARTPRGQVLAGAGAGLPTGQQTLATPTI